MATVEHKDLPNAQLHEPKGVSAAAVSTCYVANGAGSGAWSQAPYSYTLNAHITDVSTASSAWVVAPVAGIISKIYCTIDTAITVADSVVTSFIGVTGITNGTVTLAYSGSAAGSSFNATPTANRTVSAGSVIELRSDGGSTTASKGFFTIKIDVT